MFDVISRTYNTTQVCDLQIHTLPTPHTSYFFFQRQTTLIITGCHTNPALLLTIYPEVKKMIKEIVLLGGAMVHSFFSLFVNVAPLLAAVVAVVVDDVTVVNTIIFFRELVTLPLLLNSIFLLILKLLKWFLNVVCQCI